MQIPRDLKLTTCRAILPTHGIQQSKPWDTQTTQGIQSRHTFTSLKCHGHHGKSWKILMQQSRTRIVVRYCNCVLALKSQLFPGAYQNGGPIGNKKGNFSGSILYPFLTGSVLSLSLPRLFVVMFPSLTCWRSFILLRLVMFSYSIASVHCSRLDSQCLPSVVPFPGKRHLPPMYVDWTMPECQLQWSR